MPSRAAVVARPRDPAEVCAVLQLCDEARVPVTPVAGRSGVCGASIPAFGGVALDLCGMAGLLHVDDTSLVADVAPGTFGDDLEAELRGGHGLTLGPILLTPRSRGSVTIASSDPFEKPVIDPRYLSDEQGEDRAALTKPRAYRVYRLDCERLSGEGGVALAEWTLWSPQTLSRLEVAAPVPEIRASNRQTRSLGERLAVNSVMQGTAADVIKRAMVATHERLREEGRSARLVLQVHDELLLEAPETEVSAVKELVREEMVGAYELDPPLEVDVGAGDDWHDAKR